MTSSSTRSAARAGSAVCGRRPVLLAMAAVALAGITDPARRGASARAGDPLPSWNDGAAKQAILDFVREATTEGGASHLAPEERVATFDQDGTLWVEHPIYTQAVFAVDRVKALAPDHPEWATTAPYSDVIAGDEAAIAGFSEEDWAEIVGATHGGMTVEAFQQIVGDWLATATHPRFGTPYTDLVYQPMLEVMALLRANGFAVSIVSGGGQDFIRAYSERVYGVPPERVIGTTFETTYAVGPSGTPTLTKEPRLQLNDNNGGKPEDINLFVGRRPAAAFGNSTGDQQMLEWTHAGDRARLALLVHHDDAGREYAYGPAGGLPDTEVGTFTDALMQEAARDGWTVVSMKDDWNRIFPD